MTKSRKKVFKTVKKFKVKLSLEKKYIGENIPVMLRQGDMGTIIEAQIFTEDNNCYDLTGYTVTFTIQGAGSIPVLNESCKIIDAKNGIVQHEITDKDSKHPGKVQHAFFQIKSSTSTVIESTGDIDIRILEMPRILPSDYIQEVSNFKGKVRGDWSNPNTMNLAWTGMNKEYAYLNIVEWDQEIYNTTDPNIYLRSLTIPVGGSERNLICFKINPKAEKVVISNLNTGNFKGSMDLEIMYLQNVFKLGPERANGQVQIKGQFKEDHIWLDQYDIKKPGITKLKQNTGCGVPTGVEIDMKLNQDLLSADNYLAINIWPSNYYFDNPYDRTKVSQLKLIHNGEGAFQHLAFFPQITCTQYYLPE